MAPAQSLNRVAVVTSDMDRLLGWYRRVFDASVFVDVEEAGLRHVVVSLGEVRPAFLHPFEFTSADLATRGLFLNGEVDHLALIAPDEDSFWDLHRRAEAETAGIVPVFDTGSTVNFHVDDFDGTAYEVSWRRI